MFKPALVSSAQFRTALVATDESTANNVFKVLHGAYGNLFLSKFTSGVTDVKGRDQGVASARKVWAYTLCDVPEAVVLDALERCQRDDPEYPPSLPKFMEFCRACAPRATYKPEIPAIAMSQDLRSRNAARAREISVRHATGVAAKQAPPAGLPTLKALIAGAVSAAGGDEAAELNRLDWLYQSKAQGVPT